MASASTVNAGEKKKDTEEGGESKNTEYWKAALIIQRHNGGKWDGSTLVTRCLVVFTISSSLRGPRYLLEPQ